MTPSHDRLINHTASVLWAGSLFVGLFIVCSQAYPAENPVAGEQPDAAVLAAEAERIKTIERISIAHDLVLFIICFSRIWISCYNRVGSVSHIELQRPCSITY